MKGNVEVTIMGETRKIASGLTYHDLVSEYQEGFKYPILLAKVGNKYKELNEYVLANEEIQFVDLKDATGNKVYVNSLILLLSYATTCLFGYSSKVLVKYSIDKGIYITTNFDISDTNS